MFQGDLPIEDLLSRSEQPVTVLAEELWGLGDVVLEGPG